MMLLYIRLNKEYKMECGELLKKFIDDMSKNKNI